MPLSKFIKSMMGVPKKVWPLISDGEPKYFVLSEGPINQIHLCSNCGRVASALFLDGFLVQIEQPNKLSIEFELITDKVCGRCSHDVEGV